MESWECFIIMWVKMHLLVYGNSFSAHDLINDVHKDNYPNVLHKRITFLIIAGKQAGSPCCV